MCIAQLIFSPWGEQHYGALLDNDNVPIGLAWEHRCWPCAHASTGNHLPVPRSINSASQTKDSKFGMKFWYRCHEMDIGKAKVSSPAQNCGILSKTSSGQEKERAGKVASTCVRGRRARGLATAGAHHRPTTSHPRPAATMINTPCSMSNAADHARRNVVNDKSECSGLRRSHCAWYKSAGTPKLHPDSRYAPSLHCHKQAAGANRPRVPGLPAKRVRWLEQ